MKSHVPTQREQDSSLSNISLQEKSQACALGFRGSTPVLNKEQLGTQGWPQFHGGLEREDLLGWGPAQEGPDSMQESHTQQGEGEGH